MRIEISATGIGGMAVADFQTNMRSYITDAESMISSFKAVKSSTCSLSGGVGSLQSALDDVEARIRQEEAVLLGAQSVQEKANSFLALAERVDRQVASGVRQNKEELYIKYPRLQLQSASKEEKDWCDQAWDWLCGVGESIAEGAKAAWDWTKDTAKKAWDGLVDFYEKYKVEIINWGVTALCVIGSIAAIALIPATGGASIALIAGISALSSGIMAGTRSLTAQYAETGSWDNLDWGAVAKDALVGAAVGAVTGAIGAGLGGAITSGLSQTGIGATLLNSSSTAVRMATGAVIGGTSEVATGVVTRGTATAVESYLTTGSVDFGDVWDSATDPQQMLADAAIGGATGGFSVKNPSSGDVGDTTDWERTANTASEEKLLREMEANGDLDVYDVDPSLKDPVHTSQHLPKSSGTFAGEKGNSAFVPKSETARMKMKEYGVESIDYHHGEADFSVVSHHKSPWGEIDSKIEIGHMTGNRENGKWELGPRPKGTSHDPAYDLGNFAQADNVMAEKLANFGVTGKDFKTFRKDNKLIWHESADGKTMMLVPEEIHDACPHSGGVSEMKYRMQWGDITRSDE